MELKITKNHLVSALARTFGIADRKSSMQILSNVLIDAGGLDNVRIAATDLHLSASGVFPAEIQEGGAFTVPAKTLYDVVRNMSDGPISLSTEGEQVRIFGGRTNFKLLSLPADDFPLLPDSGEVEFFEMDASLLLRMIEQTSFSISNDETRPHINGALFQGDGKNLRMVTTDGHRLSKVEIHIDESGFYNFLMVIPNKGITEIRHLVEDAEGIVSLAVHDGSVFLRRNIKLEDGSEGAEPISAEFLLVSRLIESEFPPYDQVIPKGNDQVVILSRTQFLDALRRVSVVSSDRTLGVSFKFSEGNLEIITNNPSVGEGSEQLDVSYEGEDMTIGFNARYFIDILSVLNDDEVRLELSGALDPVIVKDQADTFIGVVMPMRI
ncbi:MAG: DNA polymerase III subunit beta [Proteobacteria bacterium]|nr:DNA polymerase III subunit beta [Pseudomonadota bacterium]